jgi:hypothetical protein
MAGKKGVMMATMMIAMMTTATKTVVYEANVKTRFARCG